MSSGPSLFAVISAREVKPPMSVLLVTYDLRQPNRDYEPLLAALRKYTHCHALQSTWLIDTASTPQQVRDALTKLVDSNDQLYVFRLRHHWAATRKEPCTDWLKSPDRSWD